MTPYVLAAPEDVLCCQSIQYVRARPSQWWLALKEPSAPRTCYWVCVLPCLDKIHPEWPSRLALTKDAGVKEVAEASRCQYCGSIPYFFAGIWSHSFSFFCAEFVDIIYNWTPIFAVSCMCHSQFRHIGWVKYCAHQFGFYTYTLPVARQTQSFPKCMNKREIIKHWTTKWIEPAISAFISQKLLYCTTLSWL